jgi:hypothetical protein
LIDSSRYDREAGLAAANEEVPVWSNQAGWRSVSWILARRINGGLIDYVRHLVRHAIDNRAISRKHLVIEVSAVKPGDGVCRYVTFNFDQYANWLR